MSYPLYSSKSDKLLNKKEDVKQRTEAEKFLSVILQNMFSLLFRVARLALTQNSNDHSTISQNQTSADKREFLQLKMGSTFITYVPHRTEEGSMSLGWGMRVFKDLQ